MRNRYTSNFILTFTTLILTVTLGFTTQTFGADVGQLRNAFKAIDRKDASSVLSIAQQSPPGTTHDLIYWIYAQNRKSQPSFYEVAQLIERHPQWPKLDIAQANAEPQLVSGGLSPKIIVSFFNKHAPKTGYGVAAYVNALQATGQGAKIKGVLKKAWLTLPMNTKEESALLNTAGPYLNTTDQNHRLEAMMSQERSKAVSRQMSRVSPSYQALARGWFQAKKGRSVSGLSATLRNDPFLKLEQARYYRRGDQYVKAGRILSNINDPVAYGRYFAKERSRVARLLLTQDQPRLAYSVVATHKTSKGAEFADAQWLAGWIALRNLAQPKAAKKLFSHMYDRVGFPVSKSRSAYWTARAAEQAGEKEGAQQWYQKAAHYTTSYYGQLAAAKLPENLRPRLQSEPTLSQAQYQAFLHRPYVQAMQAIASAGGKNTFEAFAKHYARRLSNPQDFVALARFGKAQGRTDIAVYSAWQAIKKNVVLTQLGYPYLSLPNADISPELVHAVARQESGFKTTAVSRAKAYGLMQLLPGTAKRLARKDGISYSFAQLTSDPTYNLRLGSAYLEQLVSRFNGLWPLALAGYNAGPGRVNRWTKQGTPHDTASMVDWIEEIPFSETRNYVQRVLENYIVYKAKRKGIKPVLDPYRP